MDTAPDLIAEDVFPVRIDGIIYGDKGITKGVVTVVHWQMLYRTASSAALQGEIRLDSVSPSVCTKLLHLCFRG